MVSTTYFWSCITRSEFGFGAMPDISARSSYAQVKGQYGEAKHRVQELEVATVILSIESRRSVV